MKYGCSIKERTTKTGVVYDARWWYYDKDGYNRRGGSYGHASKRLANAAYLEFMKTYAPPKEKRNSAPVLLFDDLLNQYFAYIVAENAEATIYSKRSVFQNHITPLFKGMDVTKITKEKLYNWQDEMWTKINPQSGTPYAYQACSNARTFFSAFLQWVEERYGIPNLFSAVKKPRRIEPKKEMLFWEESEFLTFISVVDDPLWKTFFMVLFYTGVRVGEANALTDDKIGNGRIVVNASVTRKTNDSIWKIKGTKNKKNRVNKLLSPVDEQVASYKAFKIRSGITGDFFFLGERPIPEMTYQRALSRYCEKAGVNKIRIHDFRHSYVSMLIYYGASPALIADLIGDTMEQVLKTYGHLWKSERDNIVTAIERKIKIATNGR